MLKDHSCKKSSTLGYPGPLPIWIRCIILSLLASLCSCGPNFKVLDSTADPNFWGAAQSEIWVEGKRQRIYALAAQGNSLAGKITGKGGATIVRYVFKAPPWSTSQANRLITKAQAWQNPRSWSSPGHGLYRISSAMNVPSNKRRYLLSINPLVIAITDELIPRHRDDYRVHLVDLARNVPATQIRILAGEYPAHAYLMGGQKDEAEQIRARTRTISTNGLTLVNILNSPGLWEDQEPPG